MMRSPAKNMILPAFIGAVVMLVAVTLLIITFRSPYTHSNLDPGFNPGYTRTEQTWVGSPIPFAGGKLALPLAVDRVERGRQLYVTMECAACHGLEGRGGIIGPSINGMNAASLRTLTSTGPLGMPAYAPGALTDDDLEAIAAFLNAMNK